MRVLTLVTFLSIAPAMVSCGSATADETYDPELHKLIQPMSPEDSLKTMELQDGYRMELAASEPLIEEPVLFTFDGNGRMYVAEMLTYMQDAEGSGKFQPTSRIKRLEDKDGDGIYESFTIFADNLLLPRMITTFGDGEILVRETNTLDLLLIKDTDGDGLADSKETIYVGGDRGGNLEHQPTGLIYGIDNWMYVTYTDQRYRFDGTTVQNDLMAYGGGQWGLAQDHLGRFYYSTAGGQNPAFTFQAPSVYGKITLENEQAEGFREVFPIDTTPDVQGGPKLLRDDNTLKLFTGGGGQGIYLGGVFDDLEGDYIISEPVGNLVRRAKVVRENGATQLVHPYQEARTEFIRSSDANFRPVWTDTAPDGSLYVLDMYRGIIQEGNWTQKGSYLRGIIDQYGFDKIIGRGRLYRVTKDGATLYDRPQMFSETPAELTRHLSHPNRWWRLEAQKLIVHSKDTSVVPKLKDIAANNASPLARIHALWTLEGLGVLDKALLIERFSDKHSDVRATAIRISEQLAAKGDKDIPTHWLNIAKGDDIETVQQAVLSAYFVTSEHQQTVLDNAKKKFGTYPSLIAIEKAMENLIALNEKRRRLSEENAELAQAVIEGEKSYKALCYTCHGDDGKGTPAGAGLLAPSFYESDRVTGNITSLVNASWHGMQGPINGTHYAGGAMMSLATRGNEWVANALTYIRNDFGNRAGLVTEEQVAGIVKLAGDRNAMWTQPELDRLFNGEIANKEEWKISSENITTNQRFPLTNIIDNKDDVFWQTRTQGDKQILQSIIIELPNTAVVTEVNINSNDGRGFHANVYDVEFSTDGVKWETIVKNPIGSKHDRNQTLGHKAKFIRIASAKTNDNKVWRILEISLFGSYVK